MPPKSSPTPQRRSGTRGSTFWVKASPCRATSVIGVSIQPGTMAFTRTWCRASSTARARMSEITAPLVAA